MIAFWRANRKLLSSARYVLRATCVRIHASILCTALILSVSGTAVLAEIELEPVPLPPRAMVEESVFRELQQVHDLVESMAATGDRSALRLPDLADAYGRLAGLLATYDLLDQAHQAFLNASTLDTNSFRWHYLLGWVEQRRGELKRSALHFERALELKPDDFAAWARLGEVSLALARHATALKAFGQCIEIDTSAAVAHFGYGRALARAGDTTGALDHLEKALELQPDASQIRYPLALAYRRLGMVEQARTILASSGDVKAVFADPLVENLSRGARGGSLHKLLGDQAVLAGHLDGAAAEYRQAVAADPTNLYYRRSLATTLYQLGLIEEAHHILEGALENPTASSSDIREKAKIHFILGGIARNRGEDASAALHFEAALVLDPALPEAHLELGNLRGRTGRLEEALDHFNQALEVDPSSPTILLQRATTLMDLERYDEAVSDLRKILENPSSAQVKVRWLLEQASQRAQRDR